VSTSSLWCLHLEAGDRDSEVGEEGPEERPKARQEGRQVPNDLTDTLSERVEDGAAGTPANVSPNQNF
jgi:hypothetical protein